MANTVLPAPPTPRQADADLYHGVSVPDPYRWLEDGEAPATQHWVAEQNERTRQALDARPDHGQWHERLVALGSLPVVLQATARGERLFVLERGLGAEQHALVLRSAVDPAAPPRTLVDPAMSSSDAATAIDWYEPSVDGRFVAYGTSEGGTEDSTLVVLDVDSGRHLADVIENTRAASVAWLPDSSAFSYTAYPAGDQYNRRVLLHVLGTDPADDPVVWSDPDAPQSWPGVQVSADGRYLLVEVMVGWGQVEAFVLDRETGAWTTIIAGVEAMSSFDIVGDQVLIVTTLDAPRGRVAVVALAEPGVEHWRTIVAEGDGVIGRAVGSGGEILVLVTDHAVDRIERCSIDGAPLGPIADLGIVSVGGLSASAESNDAFIVVAGFDSPASMFRYRPDAGVTGWQARDPGAGIPDLAVSQVTYPSLDGTPIGLFVIHRRDVVPGPDTPTILNGYGGFAISETPLWSPLIAAWCERGGQYAIAGLRGGLEEGEAWHQAGRRANKQNVFDDFHAAADWLVSTGRASRERLAIAGGSNGGLLVGAALTQGPDLCRAVWCAVPLLDMIRFPNFLIARLWTDEYGDPDIAEEFAWLWAYSPYHHVVPGTAYPALLLTTAEGDSRVDPLHARKMAAEMQFAAADQDERPVLLFQAGRAGHGVGKPASKRADESADVLSFFAWQLGGLSSGPSSEPAA
ncbi:MAG: Prolyl oligopeptidase [Ilumatobacteraceae bacterium]|nr:Prolyl oligopeptidase [Ilumatobacteraceae bacterium]